MKEKIKSYEFWVSVASAIMVLLQTISININIPYINEITMAFLSLLTVAGILKKTKTNESDIQSQVNDEIAQTDETQNIEETQNQSQAESQEDKKIDGTQDNTK